MPFINMTTMTEVLFTVSIVSVNKPWLVGKRLKSYCRQTDRQTDNHLLNYWLRIFSLNSLFILSYIIGVNMWLMGFVIKKIKESFISKKSWKICQPFKHLCKKVLFESFQKINKKAPLSVSFFVIVLLYFSRVFFHNSIGGQQILSKSTKFGLLYRYLAEIGIRQFYNEKWRQWIFSIYITIFVLQKYNIRIKYVEAAFLLLTSNK